MSEYANFRATKEDLALLKVVAALSRESMIQTLRRLVQQEYTRLRSAKEGKQ